MAKKAPNTKTRADDQRGAHKGQNGQQPYKPTERDRAYVKKHVFWIGQADCAKRLGISERTLSRHFKEEIETCKLDGKETLTETSMNLARKGDGPMLRFLLATRFYEDYSPKYKAKVEGDVKFSFADIDISDELAQMEKGELAVARKILTQWLAKALEDESGSAEGTDTAD